MGSSVDVFGDEKEHGHGPRMSLSLEDLKLLKNMRAEADF